MTSVYEHQFRAWSCDFNLEIIDAQRDPVEIVGAIKTTLSEYEQTFSRFKTQSLISRLNAGQAITPSPLFKQVWLKAIGLSGQIDTQYFNPHVNLASLGYNASIETLDEDTRAEETDYQVPPFPATATSQQLLQLKAGVQLDFGGFLKGLVCAQLADQYAQDCQGLVFNFGGDLTVRGQDTDRSNFTIDIHNPVTQQSHPITLQQQSLCTSGTYRRRWQNATGAAHHIIDPRSHHSSSAPFVSISFWGPDGALCDALATAAFNAPFSLWQQWVDNFTDLHFLAISPSGKVHHSHPTFEA